MKLTLIVGGASGHMVLIIVGRWEPRRAASAHEARNAKLTRTACQGK